MAVDHKKYSANTAEDFEKIAEDYKNLLQKEIEKEKNINLTLFSNTKKTTAFAAPFVNLFYHNLINVIVSDGLTKTELLVFLLLARDMEYGNLTLTKQKIIANELKIRVGEISKAFNSLYKKNILVQDEKRKLYINPNIVSKGISTRMDSVKRDAMLAICTENKNISNVIYALNPITLHKKD